MVSVLNPSTFFIPLVALVFWHSGIYNNPEYPQTRWSLGDISSKSQYSCMRGSDITLWFALLASTDFAFSEKFVISSLLSWCFAPLPLQDLSKKKPFVTLLWFCFLYVYFWHMFYFILYFILLKLQCNFSRENLQ